MDNPPKVQHGDRVRVVLEGEATHEAGAECFDIALPSKSGNCINPEAKHVVSIEVLAKPAKVGDRLVPCKSIAVMHALPDGAVLAAVVRPAELVIKKNGAWFEPGDDQPYDVQWMTAERTIVYLPE